MIFHISFTFFGKFLSWKNASYDDDPLQLAISSTMHVLQENKKGFAYKIRA